MIEWCNANSGFVMTVLTMIYVVATVIVVALMIGANRLTAQSLKTAVHLDKERSKPVVIMEVVPDIPFFRLKVRNIGLTAAHNVQFAVMPEPRLCFGGKNQIPTDKTERKIKFIAEGIRSLPPQGEVSTTLGTLKRIKEGLGSLHLQGKISYTDPLGDTHETVVDSDLAIYRGLAYPGKKTIDTVAKELEKIRQELGHIGTGFHKPKVLTQDIKEHRKEEEEEEEEEFIEPAVKPREEKQEAEQHAGQVSSEAAPSASPDELSA